MSPLDRAAYQAVLRLGHAALAWEVLRRDPAYRVTFSGLDLRRGVDAVVDPGFIARWGMHFP